MDQEVKHKKGTDTSDWQRNKSLQECMLHACSNNIYVDVVFLAGKEEAVCNLKF
jgi:hypothetical protein